MLLRSRVPPPLFCCLFSHSNGILQFSIAARNRFRCVSEGEMKTTRARHCMMALQADYRRHDYEMTSSPLSTNRTSTFHLRFLAVPVTFATVALVTLNFNCCSCVIVVTILLAFPVVALVVGGLTLLRVCGRRPGGFFAPTTVERERFAASCCC